MNMYDPAYMPVQLLLVFNYQMFKSTVKLTFVSKHLQYLFVSNLVQDLWYLLYKTIFIIIRLMHSRKKFLIHT